MITITPETLQELGIELGDATEEFMQELNQQINERVGAALLELLDDEEAKELIKVSEGGDDAATTEWIVTHVPDYKEVVQDEVDILLGELAQSEEASA